MNKPHSKFGIASTALALFPVLCFGIAVLQIFGVIRDYDGNTFYLAAAVIIPIVAIILGVIGLKNEATSRVFPTIGTVINSAWLVFVLAIYFWGTYQASRF